MQKRRSLPTILTTSSIHVRAIVRANARLSPVHIAHAQSRVHGPCLAPWPPSLRRHLLARELLQPHPCAENGVARPRAIGLGPSALVCSPLSPAAGLAHGTCSSHGLRNLDKRTGNGPLTNTTRTPTLKNRQTLAREVEEDILKLANLIREQCFQEAETFISGDIKVSGV